MPRACATAPARRGPALTLSRALPHAPRTPHQPFNSSPPYSSLSPSRTSHTHGPSRPLITVTGKLQLRSGVVVVATWQKGQVHGAGRIVYGSGCEWRGARERAEPVTQTIHSLTPAESPKLSRAFSLSLHPPPHKAAYRI